MPFFPSALAQRNAKPQGWGWRLPGTPPPLPAGIQANGLVFWAPTTMNLNVFDPVQRLTMPYLLTTSNVQTAYGAAINATVNNLGARAPCPTQLQSRLPVSLMIVFKQIAAPVSFGTYFCVSYTNSDTTPFHQYEIQENGAGGLRLAYNNAGTDATPPSFAGLPSNGNLHVLIGTLISGSQVLYLDGVNVASRTDSITSISVGSNSLLGLGCYVDGINRNAGIQILDARIYNRALSAAEALLYTNNWADLYEPQNIIRSKYFFAPVSSAPPTFEPYWAVGANQITLGRATP